MRIPTRILARAFHLLTPGGLALVEHSESQGEAMRHAARCLGYETIQTKRDLTGRERFLIAERGRMPQ